MRRPLAALALLAGLTACSTLEPLTIAVEQRAGRARLVPLVIDGQCFWEAPDPTRPDLEQLLPLAPGRYAAVLDLRAPNPVVRVDELSIPLVPGEGCRR